MSATEAKPVNPILKAWDSDQGRKMESEDPRKILEFSQLSENRTILDSSQVTVLNELEVSSYASKLAKALTIYTSYL